MPVRAVDLFSVAEGGTHSPEGAHEDLAVSLDGRHVYIYSRETIHYHELIYSKAVDGRMFVLDTDKLSLQEVDCSEVIFGSREHYFTFVLSSQTFAILMEVLVKGVWMLCVFKVTLDSATMTLSKGKLVAQPLPLAQAPERVIACQWGTDVFVIIANENAVRFQRFDTIKFSTQYSVKTMFACDIRDAVAYDERIFCMKAAGNRWIDTKQILITEFENNYKCEWKDLFPDPVHGWPVGSDFAMDLWEGNAWVYAELRETKSYSLWRLCLESLVWTKVNVQLPHPLYQPILHCLPMGKAFLLGDCPDFPISWLPTLQNQNQTSGGPSGPGAPSGHPPPPPLSPQQCLTPAHLYSFWLDVPRLDRLAWEALTKTSAGDMDKRSLRAIGVPRKFVPNSSLSTSATNQPVENMCHT